MTSRHRPNPEEIPDMAKATTPVATDTTVKATKAKAGRVCDCGCNGTTKGGRFLPGHDASLKSKLLKRLDAGDHEAQEILIENGWYTLDRLNERRAKAEAKAEAKVAKQAKDAG
jgi:hypothetical protein